MVRARPTLPAGHGEVITTPACEAWPGILRANAQVAASWSFEVAGRSIRAVRAQARREALAQSEAFSRRLAIEVDCPRREDDPIVMTGHQPELYHPGVWVKDFLLDRFSKDAAATAIDLVVDSDAFDAVSITAPRMRPRVERCEVKLASGGPDACFASTPVPSTVEIGSFCEKGAAALETLRTSAIRKHFEAFCGLLKGAAEDARNVAEFVTFARRRYESCVGTTYLELPVTSLARSGAFAAFVVDVAQDAGRFVAAYNDELDEYRAITNTRSPAQPFPNLERGGERFELPFWHLGGERRETVWAEARADGGCTLVAGGTALLTLPPEPEDAVEALAAARLALAPKAVALTLFARVFVADLFIHGIGGARYDRVTDGVIRRYFGIEPPQFVVASMTMYLPLGAHIVSDEELAAATERVNRFDHNPDSLLDQVDFESRTERVAAVDLAAEKESLVTAIARPDADRKVLGSRIRDINEKLRSLLGPYGTELRADLERLKAERAVAEVLTDRTYPFCFWSPAEIADSVR